MPDYLYREAKRIAEQYEMSMAEVVRRGLGSSIDLAAELPISMLPASVAADIRRRVDASKKISRCP